MEKKEGMKYRRFLAMIATSTAVMLGLMYLNTFAWDHVFWSETRFWMAFLMGAAMAIIMLSFMLGMYQDPKKNALIYAGSVVVFVGALYLVRSQQTIDDVAYMRAMIPHHSIAIMTSERAHIEDPRTRELAKSIITAQRREIAEMKYLIADIEENGVRPHSDPPPRAEPTGTPPEADSVEAPMADSLEAAAEDSPGQPGEAPGGEAAS